VIINPQVPLHRLILSLSEALDHVHPEVVDHQQRVAYIAINVARRMGFSGVELLDLFQAAALHDIGLIGAENRYRALHLGQLEEVRWHSELGYALLKRNPMFAGAAELIRYHHASDAHDRATESASEPIPLGAHILDLADKVERMIDRSVPVLDQVESIRQKIVSQSGTSLQRDCVDAFCHVARAEAFWMDVVSRRIYSILLSQMDWPTLIIDEVSLGPIAELFGQVVDACSPWTALHSAGVAASAVALAERLNFSPRELHLMRAAGYLHDLGKLSIPARLLDKPGKLTPQEMAVIRGHTYHTFRILNTIGGMPQISEWAAFHHERLDGNGYPFHHAGDDLTLGSRIVAVADMFTAVAEDRPYRKGMSLEEALGLLKKQAASGGLDGDVVDTLETDREAMDASRRQEQAAYAEKQSHVLDLMGRSKGKYAESVLTK
jgi:putative nucleotidyltransferase with HDIG domain